MPPMAAESAGTLSTAQSGLPLWVASGEAGPGDDCELARLHEAGEALEGRGARLVAAASAARRPRGYRARPSLPLAQAGCARTFLLGHGHRARGAF
jgi:hypothetical protein